MSEENIVVNNHIGQTLDNAGNEIRLDANAKEILADKNILAEIIHALIPGFESVPLRDIPDYIANTPEIGSKPVHPGETNMEVIRGLSQENTFAAEGKAMFDVFFPLRVPGADGGTAGVYVNLEAQASEKKSYTMEQRAVYYMARLISSQYERDFNKSHYEKIKKVFSIWIIFDPDERYADSISSFFYQQKAVFGFPKEDGTYDLSQAFIVRLKARDEIDSANRLIGVLGTIFSKKVSTHLKKDILANKYGVPVSRELERRVDEMCNYSESVRNYGRAEGRAEERISLLTDLYLSGDISKETAMSRLNMTSREFDAALTKYRAAGEIPS